MHSDILPLTHGDTGAEFPAQMAWLLLYIVSTRHWNTVFVFPRVTTVCFLLFFNEARFFQSASYMIQLEIVLIL